MTGWKSLCSLGISSISRARRGTEFCSVHCWRKITHFVSEEVYRRLVLVRFFVAEKSGRPRMRVSQRQCRLALSLCKQLWVAVMIDLVARCWHCCCNITVRPPAEAVPSTTTVNLRSVTDCALVIDRRNVDLTDCSVLLAAQVQRTTFFNRFGRRFSLISHPALTARLGLGLG